MAAMAMPRVLENDRPKRPAAIRAAVMLADNQVSFGFRREVLLSSATGLAAFD